MSFTICSNEMPDIVCDSHSDIRIWEAFFRGMQMDYTLTYPDGKTMEVNFKSKSMNEITRLDQKIEDVKKQLHHLTDSNSISSKERNELRQYYENKLNSYNAKRKSLVENIEVEGEVFGPERE